MIKNIIKSIRYIFICIISSGVMFAYSFSASAEEQHRDLDLEVKLSQTSILLYEPVGVAAYLKNAGNGTIDLNDRSWRMSVFTRRGEAEEWIGYSKAGGLSALIRMPEKRTLRKGQFVDDYQSLSINYNLAPIFPAPGTYYIKICLGPKESAPQKITVLNPSLNDKRALESIQKWGLYKFFDSDSMLGFFQRHEIDDAEVKKAKQQLENIIRLYPISRYTPWCKLALLNIDEVHLLIPILQRSSSTPQERTALDNVENSFLLTALQLSFPLNALAWYEAGVSAAFRHDYVRSNANFSKSVSLDSTLVPKVTLFKATYIGELPATPLLAHPANAQEILNSTIKSLENQGYDVQGFSKKYPSAYREYLNAALPLLQKHTRGEMPDTEYYKRVAELLRQAVTKAGK